jgi:hypothetical protein
MPEVNYQVTLVMGGFFLLLGIIFIFWNKREKGKYYNSILLTRRDIKESITHEPYRPWLHAWQVGGRVSLVVGIVLLIMSGVLWSIAH